MHVLDYSESSLLEQIISWAEMKPLVLLMSSESGMKVSVPTRQGIETEEAIFLS